MADLTTNFVGISSPNPFWVASGRRMAGFNNIESIIARAAEANFRELAEAKRRRPDRAVIASLFVTTRERWHEFVRRSAATGADGDGAYPCIDLVDPGLHHLPPARMPGRLVPLVRGADCVGCNLCSIVGPVDGCMQMVPIDSGKPPLSWEHYQAGLAAGTISPNPAQP